MKKLSFKYYSSTPTLKLKAIFHISLVFWGGFLEGGEYATYLLRAAKVLEGHFFKQVTAFKKNYLVNNDKL